MKLEFQLADESSVENAIHLRNFVADEGIEGVESVEVQRGEHSQGEMGVGILLSSVAAVLSSVGQPLVELIKCLQLYVTNFRTTIRIPTPNGDIVLEHGRSMKPEQIQELVTAIQNSKS